MSAMAASLGVESDFIEVQVIHADRWHRRVRLGAFGWWAPEGCQRTGEIDDIRDDPPADGVMCKVCWPVWPPLRRRTVTP